MKKRWVFFAIIFLFLEYVNLSLHYGPFTKYEQKIIRELIKAKIKYNQQRHLANLESKANEGHAESQFQYAFTFLNPKSERYDQEKAIYWFEQSGDNGFLDGYHKIAYGLDKGAFGFKKSFDKDKILVEKYYRKASEQGFAKSQNNLAILLSEKHGETTDLEEIKQLRLDSAEGGDIYGITNLAKSYLRGTNGFEEDLGKALYWLEKAYDTGRYSPQIPVNIAWILTQKDGPDYRPKQAGIIFWETASKGDLYSIKQVANAFARGKLGYPRDKDKAHEWYKKAAALGDEEIQSYLGRVYLHKMGEAEDVEKQKEYKEQAIKWLQKSADQGNNESLNKLNELNQKEDH